MALTTKSVKTASEAWKLLRGIVCVYKPSDYNLRTFVNKIKSNLAQDLNEMERSIESNYIHPMDSELALENHIHNNNNDAQQLNKYESDFAELVAPDYSRHPLVLGKGK